MWFITPTFLKLFSLGLWDTPRTSPLTGGSCAVWPSLLLNNHVTKTHLQDPSVCSNSLVALILSYSFKHLYILMMPHWLRSQKLPRNSRRALMWVFILCMHSIWDFSIWKSDSHLKLSMPPLVSLSIPFSSFPNSMSRQHMPPALLSKCIPNFVTSVKALHGLGPLPLSSLSCPGAIAGLLADTQNTKCSPIWGPCARTWSCR